GMEQMVDAIGGVPMCFEEDLYAPKAELDVSAGCHTLDGKTAVAFARARKGIGDGSDISRIGRQQELLMNMVEKVLDSNLLTDTADLYQFLKAATSSLTTSDDIGNLSTMVGLAYSLRGIDLEDVNFATLPFAWAAIGSSRTRPRRSCGTPSVPISPWCCPTEPKKTRHRRIRPRTIPVWTTSLRTARQIRTRIARAARRPAPEQPPAPPTPAEEPGVPRPRRY